MTTVLFDNEAVQALIDPHHRKHRTVVAHLLGTVAKRRHRRPSQAQVPTAVRVEAGWDRTDPAFAAANRLRVLDVALDRPQADLAAEIRTRTGVSVADAHLGAVIQGLDAGDVVVLTSDPDDAHRVAAPRSIVAVRI